MTNDPTTSPQLAAVQAAMVATAGEFDWRSMTLLATAVRDWAAVRLHATATGGPVVDLELQRADDHFAQLRVAVHRLREAMHEPERGTWYNAAFTLERGGELEPTYDYDNPPFAGWVDGSTIVWDDHELPRADLPAWHPAPWPNPDRWQLFPYRVIDLPAAEQPAQASIHELSSVGRAMSMRIDQAGLDWDRVVLKASAAGPTVGASLTVHHPDGTRSRAWTVPDRDFLERVERLRDRMYEPGRGTWYNATLTLERDAPHRDPEAHYDYDNPPHTAAGENLEAGFPSVVDELREDQEKYPRDDEHLPAWHPSRDAGLDALRQARAAVIDDDAEQLDHSIQNWLRQRMIGAAVEVEDDKYRSSGHETRRNPWERIKLTVSAAGTKLHAQLYIQRPGWEELPEEFIDILGMGIFDGHELILSGLRRRMHKHGTGTWYTATFTIDQTGELHEEYDFDNRPRGIDEHHLRDDQDTYYRDEDHLPEWHPERTDPPPRISLTDERPATDDPLLILGYALLDHLPDDWTSARLYVTSAAETVRTWVDVDTGHSDEPGEEAFAVPEIAAECLALRKSMYEPGKGTWYNATITLEHKSPHVGQLTTRFDNERRPFVYWGPEEIELVHRDIELFPRDPDWMPEWHPLRPDDADDEDYSDVEFEFVRRWPAGTDPQQPR